MDDVVLKTIKKSEPLRIDAVLVAGTPVVWEYNLQLISDFVISKDGRPGSVREPGSKQAVPLYLSATDLHVEDEFPLPRF